MSNPQLKQLLSKNDKGLMLVDDTDSGLLAGFMRLIFKDTNLTWMAWDRMFRDYFAKNQDTIQYDDQGKPVTNRSLRGNLQKNMARGGITWSSYLRVMRILGVSGMEMSMVLYYKRSKKPTYHSMYMPLDEGPDTKILSPEELVEMGLNQFSEVYNKHLETLVKEKQLTPEVNRVVDNMMSQREEELLDDVETYINNRLKNLELYDAKGNRVTLDVFNKKEYQNDRTP